MAASFSGLFSVSSLSVSGVFTAGPSFRHPQLIIAGAIRQMNNIKLRIFPPHK
jgi:hypothetical protein